MGLIAKIFNSKQHLVIIKHTPSYSDIEYEVECEAFTGKVNNVKRIDLYLRLINKYNIMYSDNIIHTINMI